MVNLQSIPSPAFIPRSARTRRTIRSSLVAAFGADQPLKLDCGIDLSPFQIAYQTYGDAQCRALATPSWSAMR